MSMEKRLYVAMIGIIILVNIPLIWLHAGFVPYLLMCMADGAIISIGWLLSGWIMKGK